MLGADRLSLAENPDPAPDLVPLGDGAAQGDSLQAVSADRVRLIADFFLHVEINVGDFRLDGAVELDAPLEERGPKLSVRRHEGRCDVPQLVLEIGFPLFEGEPAALRFLHDADLDVADRGQPLALHLRRNLPIERVVAWLEIPDFFAVAGVRLQDDLRGPRVLLQPVRSGADRMSVRVLAVELDHFPRHRAAESVREDMREAIVDFLEVNSQGIPVGNFESRDLRFIIEPAGLLGLSAEPVEPDDLSLEQERVRRTVPGIEKTLDGI